MKTALAIVFILFGLLFFGGPEDYDSRIFKQIWGTGHFVLFASVIFVLMQTKLLEAMHWFRLFIGTFIFCSFFGLATETLQLLVGRNFELYDLVNDIIGGQAGLLLSRLILLSRQKRRNRKTLLSFHVLVRVLCTSSDWNQSLHNGISR